MPKYPKIKVQLSGVNGNAFVILGTVRYALRAAKLPEAEVTAFVDEAKSKDYDHLLQTCMRWVSVS
jgi:hypothetical protein